MGFCSPQAIPPVVGGTVVEVEELVELVENEVELLVELVLIDVD